MVHRGTFLGPDVQSKAAVPPAGKVQFKAEQEHKHWGCLAACHPSPVESKCVTACETDMYQCVDETGPNETPEDTKKCQEKVLAYYQETKGLSKEQVEAMKAAEKAAAEKKAAEEAAA